MFGLLAAVAFAVAYVEELNGGHPPAALSPAALVFAGLFLLTLHLLGVGSNWTRKP